MAEDVTPEQLAAWQQVCDEAKDPNRRHSPGVQLNLMHAGAQALPVLLAAYHAHTEELTRLKARLAFLEKRRR